jgi:replicative DNA helicase
MHEAARQHHRRDRDVLNIREAGELVMQRLQDTRFLGGITGVRTGWDNYDSATGGYQNTDIISLVARMGVGKTYVLLKQAHYAHAFDNRSVLIVTTEMSSQALAQRYASIGLGINPTLLKKNMISTYTERRIGSFFRDMHDADRLRIFSVGMNSNVGSIAALCDEYRPDIVYIDGVYLLQPNNAARNASRTERITYVFDDLKALNLEMNCPFVVSTQFNRMAGKGGKDGSLETIGYTDAIGTHSSVVVAIKDGPTENPRASRMMDILKGREGEHGSFPINFRFAPLDMSEIPYDPETGQAATGEDTGAADQNWME